MTERLRGRRAVEKRRRTLAHNPLCAYCLKENPPRVTPATQVDHRTPLSQGGTDDEDNRDPICDEHHKVKSALEAGKTPRLRQRIGADGYPVRQ